MPYIVAERRRDCTPGDIEYSGPTTPGELNFAITVLIQDYLDCIKVDPVSYTDYNEVIGVLECAKLELYRRPITSYENKKLQTNGDVY